MSPPDTRPVHWAVGFAIAAHALLPATSLRDRSGGWSFYTPYSKVDVWSLVGQGFAFLAFGAWSAALAWGAFYLWRQRWDAIRGRSGLLVSALGLLLVSYVVLASWSALQNVLSIGAF